MIKLNGRLMKKRLNETLEIIRESEEDHKRIDDEKIQRQGEDS